MRITRLKLVNFIGIKHGLNENEIEIVFPDNGNSFTMLIGGNGSGKSTILSQLHPFKESFDDRKELIIPGSIGIKEIDIEHNGSTYCIKHIYDKTTASFIEKDGEELNPNGKVRTFEDVVKTELEVTKDYFKIGKIGSNTDNFVQFSTSQRKDYISNFVQDVEKYLEKFKIVSDKFKIDTDKIKTIGKELGKYEDANTLKMSLEANKRELEDTENAIIELTKESTIKEENIKNLLEKIKDIDYIALKEELNKLNKEVSTYLSTIEVIKMNYKDDSDFENNLNKIHELEQELKDKQIKFALINKEIEELKNKLVSSINTKTNNEYKLNGLSVSTSYEELKDKSNKLQEHLAILENKYNNLEIKPYIESQIDNISQNLIKYENFMMFVLNNYSILNNSNVFKKRNIEIFFSKDCPSLLKEEILKIRKLILGEEKRKESLNKDYGIKCANISKLDILEKRPITCKDDNCPFIADALKYKNLPDEIANIESELNELAKSLEKYDKVNEVIDDVKNLYKQTAYQFKLMDPQNNSIYKYQLKKYKTIVEITKNTYNETMEFFTNIKNEVEEFITLYNEIAEYKSELEKIIIELEKAQNAESIKAHFQSEIDTASKDIKTLNESILIKNEEFNEMTNQISELSVYINHLISFKDSTKKHKQSSERLEEVSKLIKLYEDVCEQKTQENIQLSQTLSALKLAQENKTKLTKTITQQEIDLARLKELNKQIKELNKSYANLKLVKDALDPKSGIPLVFIQAYLGKTELIANELLNLAFNGEFEIHFHSSAKDFFIEVRTGENYKADIKLASQGEIALTTISISLALIEQSIGNFNILSLDEIDASLDSNNREAFISILNSQINKLGIEQVFIISHNNAFDSVPMNIIALHGSEEKTMNTNFMDNKTIIYSV